jgi:hypothetical protein
MARGGTRNISVASKILNVVWGMLPLAERRMFLSNLPLGTPAVTNVANIHAAGTTRRKRGTARTKAAATTIYPRRTRGRNAGATAAPVH